MDADRTLLLIDDDETTRELLTLLLTDAGWHVRAAEDGASALRTLAAGPCPAVILSDLQMPGMSGAELVLQLRRVAPEAKLLAMTATPGVLPPAGYDALLTKPFAPDAVDAACASSTHSAATKVEEHSSVIDPVLLRQLQGKMTKQQLHTLLTMAADDAEQRIARMEEAARCGNDVLYRREAHALKGSCAMVGATKVRDLAQIAESNGSDGGVGSISERHGKFAAELEQFRLMLDLLFSRGTT